MKLTCQQEAYSALMNLAKSNSHSVLITGTRGCGKTWLSREYGKLLNVDDFVLVSPTVAAIREVGDACSVLTTPIVLCIENLDTGVNAASQVLLKFLEEPRNNVYIVVTVRNIDSVPATIRSRSKLVTVAVPRDTDKHIYAAEKLSKVDYQKIAASPIFKACSGFSDIDEMAALSVDQLGYLTDLVKCTRSADSISNLTWKLNHYPDNSPIDLNLALRCIHATTSSAVVRQLCAERIADLELGRIAPHAIAARFLFDCKYV